MVSYYYNIHGLSVVSEIELSGYGAENADRGGGVDLWIREGVVPDHLSGREGDASSFELDSAHTLFKARDAGKFLVGESEVVFEKFPPATDADIRAFLVSIVMYVVLGKKGKFALHASAVEYNGRALLFCGPVGTGKSTLAAGFLQKGARMISDDLTCVEVRADAACAQPGLCALQLWPDSLTALGEVADGYGKVRPALEKRLVPIWSVQRKEVRIGAVFFLQREQGCSLDVCVRPEPHDMMAYFDRNSIRGAPQKAGYHQFPCFAAALRLSRLAPVFSISRRFFDPALDETIGLVLGCLDGK